jgi:hypothetical protein
MYVAVLPARTRALLANGCTDTQSWAACWVFVGLGLGDGLLLLLGLGLGDGLLLLVGLAVGVGVLVLRGLVVGVGVFVVVGLAVGVGVLVVLGLGLCGLGSGDGDLKVDCGVGPALPLGDAILVALRLAAVAVPADGEPLVLALRLRLLCVVAGACPLTLRDLTAAVAAPGVVR